MSFRRTDVFELQQIHSGECKQVTFSRSFVYLFVYFQDGVEDESGVEVAGDHIQMSQTNGSDD